MSGPRRALLRLRRAHTALAGRRTRTVLEWPERLGTAWRAYDSSLEPAFRRLGLDARHRFFPHRVYRLPKAGPDALGLADRMCGVRDPARLWLLLLHAGPAARERFPEDLFRDDELLWHRQDHGLPGHVAYACLAEHGGTLYGLCYVSDLVQRIGRRREHKTRVENAFRGWPYVLLNAILDFARERRIRHVRSPTADHVLRHVDPERDVGRGLFDRVYDHPVQRLHGPDRRGGWWRIDAGARGAWIVRGESGREASACGPVVAVCHDIERGLGHEDVDREFARRVDGPACAALPAMLAIERELGVRATYHVAGRLLEEVRAAIEADGHALGFHSFDHDLEAPQLEACRRVDRRIRGYRPPRSLRTPELTHERLCRRGFEWLASGAGALGIDRPRLASGLVEVPIHADDHALHVGDVDWERWSRAVVERAARGPFTAIGLHDCYAESWLEAYPGFLEELSRSAEPWTLERVARRLTLAAAV